MIALDDAPTSFRHTIPNFGKYPLTMRTYCECPYTKTISASLNNNKIIIHWPALFRADPITGSEYNYPRDGYDLEIEFPDGIYDANAIGSYIRSALFNANLFVINFVNHVSFPIDCFITIGNCMFDNFARIVIWPIEPLTGFCIPPKASWEFYTDGRKAACPQIYFFTQPAFELGPHETPVYQYDLIRDRHLWTGLKEELIATMWHPDNWVWLIRNDHTNY